MEEVEVISRPETRVALQSPHLKHVASRQKYPDLRIEGGSYPEGQLIKTLSFIEFELPNDAFVTLQLFDSSGQEVYRVLQNALLKAGIHQVTFSREKIMHTPRLYRLTVESEGRVCVDVKRLR